MFFSSKSCVYAAALLVLARAAQEDQTDRGDGGAKPTYRLTGAGLPPHVILTVPRAAMSYRTPDGSEVAATISLEGGVGGCFMSNKGTFAGTMLSYQEVKNRWCLKLSMPSIHPCKSR